MFSIIPQNVKTRIIKMFLKLQYKVKVWEVIETLIRFLEKFLNPGAKCVKKE